MRIETKPYGWSPVDHMNARRAAKPASGGKNYAATDRIRNGASERERLASLDSFERIREETYYRFAAIRAEGREALARLRSGRVPDEDIPF